MKWSLYRNESRINNYYQNISSIAMKGHQSSPHAEFDIVLVAMVKLKVRQRK